MTNPSIMEQGLPACSPQSGPDVKQGGLPDLGARLAHAFSDSLTVINGHAALLLERGGDSPEILRHASAIHRAGSQAARLAEQLLIISGRHVMQVQRVDLHDTIRDVEPAIRRMLGAGRLLDVRLSTAPAVAQTDPALFEQVLLGLAANACEATPEGGTISILTDNVTVTEAEMPRHHAGRPGSYVRLTVRDTGRGMTPEALAEAVEPYRIPRQAGGPAGYGLAAIQGVMRASQGWITIGSQPQAGTTLRLHFPSAPADGIAGDPGADGTASTSARNTLLLVEDEPALRELMVMMLQSRGYRVLQAGGSAEALETWKWHAARIDLLFTDIVLPGDLSGLELAARFQAEKPSLRIVCLSGNPEGSVMKDSPPLEGLRFLQKPCSMQVVEQTVRATLGLKST